MCKICPFRTDGNAIDLAPGRLEEIKQGLVEGGYNAGMFYCHETTEKGEWDDDSEDYFPSGDELLCSGSLDYQDEMGASNNYRRVAERLEAMSVRDR